MKVTKTFGMIASAFLLGAMAMPVMAQTDPNAPGGAAGAAPAQPGGPGGGRNFDPAQFRQRMEERLKEQLGMTDDEFNAVKPKIEKVMDLRRDVDFGGRGRGPRGGGAPAPDASTANASPVQQASRDLRSTLDNKDSKPDDIKAKLDALRAAKSKAKDDLASAQKDLQSVLTQRQEAVLVMDGMLN